MNRNTSLRRLALSFSFVFVGALAALAACSSSDTGGSSSGTSSGTGGTAGGGGTLMPPPGQCVMQGAKGNSLGVGEYCTPGGGECADNSAAYTCLADIGQSQWFCAKIQCTSSTECGENATCYMTSEGSACVPTICAETLGTGGAGGGGTGGSGGSAGGAH